MTTKAQETASRGISRAWLTQYGLAYLGSCIGWSAPSQLLLGKQLIELTPGNKETSLSLLMMAGGFVMVITSLITGTLSDKTRSRLGRRMPWILGMGFAAAVLLTVMPWSANYAVLFALWALFQAANAFVTNLLLTIGPDVAPRHKYGLISGVLGAAYTLGVVVGTAIASALPLSVAYAVTAAAAFALVAQLAFGPGMRAILGAEHSAGGDTTDFGAVSAREVIRSAGLLHSRYRNYWWVFASRFVVHLGNFAALFYLLYYLRDYIQVADPDTAVLILTVVYALATVATTVLGGQLSDRLDRRKIFVFTSSFGVAAACVLMAFAHTFPVTIVAAALLGAAWGVFTAVDQAMINESLPSDVHRARDVSVMTLTVGIANMVSGGAAAVALSALGGYQGLYIACAVLCGFGALLVLPVKSSK